ncbi:hypothetical protein ACFQL1_03595 [Halomicroarcula sp. GCM10025709]|uniref:hypothetical protein n=1 Tax=Haloarcula TaxID=2237 RepID=UPI0024C3CE30|nr:hypothetical protein [Halomicroarcula sp. YJ-61-S]
MSEEPTETETAVTEFLAAADAAYEEYENGYADADATLRQLESAISDLRTTVEE